MKLPALGVAPSPHTYRDLGMLGGTGFGHDAEAVKPLR